MSDGDVIDLRAPDAQERIEARMTASSYVRCVGVGSIVETPTVSDMAECPVCGERVLILTCRFPGRPVFRTIGWHEVPVLAGAG